LTRSFAEWRTRGASEGMQILGGTSVEDTK
jgi:hypothetical protein